MQPLTVETKTTIFLPPIVFMLFNDGYIRLVPFHSQKNWEASADSMIENFQNRNNRRLRAVFEIEGMLA
jgi:hypothetical protein